MNGNRREAPPRSIQGTVCVIDGDPGIRNSLHTLLSTLDVKATTFSSAEEFLRHLNDGKPAFLITELTLRGMGGLDLKRTLNDRELFIPTIGLTGATDPWKEKEAASLGFLDLVEKPIVYWSVVQRIQETLGTAK